MKEIESFKKYYNITEEEEQLLKEVHSIIIDNINLFYSEFERFFKEDEEISRFRKHFDKNFKKNFRRWIDETFDGKYGPHYITFLKRIGYLHAKNGLRPHIFTVSLGIIRRILTEIIRNYYEDVEMRVKVINAVNKILDFNIDVVNAQLRTTELEDKFFTYKLESRLIKFTENFSHFINLFLVICLVVLSLSIIYFFIHDFSKIFHGEIEKGLLSALGTMLILWMMIELIEVEVKNLKEHKIDTKIFISVVIIAFIRKILIMTFEKPDLMKELFLVGTVLILAVVYFLISKSDRNV